MLQIDYYFNGKTYKRQIFDIKFDDFLIALDNFVMIGKDIKEQEAMEKIKSRLGIR